LAREIHGRAQDAGVHDDAADPPRAHRRPPGRRGGAAVRGVQPTRAVHGEARPDRAAGPPRRAAHGEPHRQPALLRALHRSATRDRRRLRPFPLGRERASPGAAGGATVRGGVVVHHPALPRRRRAAAARQADHRRAHVAGPGPSLSGQRHGTGAGRGAPPGRHHRGAHGRRRPHGVLLRVALRRPRPRPRRRARQGAVHLPVGGESGAAVPRPMRVAVPPADVRSPDPAAGATQRRRRRRRHGHQPRRPPRRHGHQPVRGRVLPGRRWRRRRAGGCHGVRRDLRDRVLPRLPREAAHRPGHRRELQRRRARREEVPAPGIVGSSDLPVQDTCPDVTGVRGDARGPRCGENVQCKGACCRREEK
jgi:hypothetical protein